MASYIPKLSEAEKNSVITDLIYAFPEPSRDPVSYAATVKMVADAVARDERFRYHADQNAIDAAIIAEAIAFESQFKVGDNEEPARQMRKFFKREHEKRDVLFDEEEYAAEMYEVFRARMDELYQHGYYFEEIIDADGEMTTVVKPLSTTVRR
jgi:hypothetical protein